jgi:hypothetical protein
MMRYRRSSAEFFFDAIISQVIKEQSKMNVSAKKQQNNNYIIFITFVDVKMQLRFFVASLFLFLFLQHFPHIFAT